MPAKLAFIGCGAMGAPMVERLIDAGHGVRVYDPNPAAIGPLVKRGAVAAASPRDAAMGSEITFACLPTPQVSRSVALDPDGIGACKGLGIYVEMSTIGSKAVKEIAASLGKHAIDVLDAPVSGGPRGARGGTLSTMVAGQRAAFERAKPLLETIARHVFYIGETPGLGQVTKLANNMISAAGMASAFEASAMAVKAARACANSLTCWSPMPDFGSLSIDTQCKPPPSAPRIKDERSFARAATVARAIVAERHDRPSLVSNIACEIAAEIIEGLRHPGDDLNSVELSRRYRTSRTPIREALMLLEKEALVQIPPRRRPRVASLAMEEVREIYRARAALFESIATDVARSASADGIAALRAALGEMERSYRNADLNGYIWANVDFYDRNTQLANNRTVKRILDSLLLRTLRLRRLSLSQPGRMQQSFDDHIRLMKAYEDRDANLAAALIRSNHINALAALERCLSGRER